MSSTAPRRRFSVVRLRALAVLGLLLGLTAASTAGPAFAHDELLGTDPTEGAVVDVLPDALTLTFSGVLLDEEGATKIVVTDAAGADLAGGEPVLDGVRVQQPLAGTATGTVSVAWRVVSSDGHPISGEYSFSVGAAGEPVPTATAESSGGAGGGEELLPVWIGAGVVVLLGVVVTVLLTRRRPSRED